MKTKAAVLWKMHGTELLGKTKPITIEMLDIDDPKEGEVMMKMCGSGVCHSDHHVVDGMYTHPYPVVLGHEGCGQVFKLGPGCKRLKEGEYGITSWMPPCGVCKWCVIGRPNLCNNGANLMAGTLPDGTYRLHKGKENIGQLHFLGTFSEYLVCPEASVTVIDSDLPMDVMGITGCCVPTGFGAAVNTAKVTPGSDCIVVGCGGIGTACIQGCRISGASNIICVDNNDDKLKKMAQFGATHTFNNDKVNVIEAVREITKGNFCDFGFECIATEGTQNLMLECVAKGATGVLVGLMWDSITKINYSPFVTTLSSKRILGSCYGDSIMGFDIPRLGKLYKTGQLKLKEMITKYYKLEQINEAMDDMLQVKNVRGMITYL